MERIGKRERGMEGIGRHTLVSAVSTVEGTVRPSHGCRQTPREDGGGEEEGRDTNLEVLASRLVGMTKAVVLGTHGA